MSQEQRQQFQVHHSRHHFRQLQQQQQQEQQQEEGQLVMSTNSKNHLKNLHLHKNNSAMLFITLTDMANSLVMGLESYLRHFDADAAVPLLVTLLEKHVTENKNGDIIAITLRTLSLVLEHAPSSYEAALQHHKPILKVTATCIRKALCKEWKYNQMDTKMLLEEGLRVTKFVINDDTTGSLMKLVYLGDLLTLCVDEDNFLSRQALETLLTLCGKVCMPSAIEKEHKKTGFFSSLFKFGNFRKSKEKKDDKTHKIGHVNSDYYYNNNDNDDNSVNFNGNTMTSVNTSTVTQVSPSLRSISRSVESMSVEQQQQQQQCYRKQMFSERIAKLAKKGVYDTNTSINKYSNSVGATTTTTTRSSTLTAISSTDANADHPIVAAVENVIAPFLFDYVDQLGCSYAFTPEVWPMLELALQCIGVLIERALLCHRLSTARVLVTAELPVLLYQLINLMDNNNSSNTSDSHHHHTTLESSLRTQRVLFCETLLSLFASCRRNLMLQGLLHPQARAFFHRVLEESNEDVSTLLHEPFIVNTTSSSSTNTSGLRNTQRRDQDQITSIAALHLLLLACPSVESSAFGPKPKRLLPVHQWLWDDELRHANRLLEEPCVTLESCWQRLERQTMISAQGKTIPIDLHLMIMNKDINRAQRNVHRRFTPFIFHFADEATLRPAILIKETGPLPESETTEANTSTKAKEPNKTSLQIIHSIVSNTNNNSKKNTNNSNVNDSIARSNKKHDKGMKIDDINNSKKNDTSKSNKKGTAGKNNNNNTSNSNWVNINTSRNTINNNNNNNNCSMHSSTNSVSFSSAMLNNYGNTNNGDDTNTSNRSSFIVNVNVNQNNNNNNNNNSKSKSNDFNRNRKGSNGNSNSHHGEAHRTSFSSQQTLISQSSLSLSHTSNTSSNSVEQISVAEEYLALLCYTSTHCSGQMARQLATCACASMLQLALLSRSEFRLRALMLKLMLPMCEMFRETLISSAKAIKAVVLSMIEWILNQSGDWSWHFCVIARRCGLLHRMQLVYEAGKQVPLLLADANLSRTSLLSSRSKELMDLIHIRTAIMESGQMRHVLRQQLQLEQQGSNVVLFSPQSITSTDGKGVVNVIDTNSGAHNSCVNNCSLSFTITKGNSNSFVGSSSNSINNNVMAINYTVNNGMDIVKSLSFSSNDADKLHHVAETLKMISSERGTHDNIVCELFETLTTCNDVTAFEVCQMNLAGAIMAYLFDNKSISELVCNEVHVKNDANSNNKNISNNTNNNVNASQCFSLYDDTHEDMICVNRPHCVRVPTCEFDEHSSSTKDNSECSSERQFNKYQCYNKEQMAAEAMWPLLLSSVNWSRLRCLRKCGFRFITGTRNLITHLLTALPVQSEFPLVESIITTDKVQCRNPRQAYLELSQISPMVKLCCCNSSNASANETNIHLTSHQNGSEGVPVLSSTASSMMGSSTNELEQKTHNHNHNHNHQHNFNKNVNSEKEDSSGKHSQNKKHSNISSRSEPSLASSGCLEDVCLSGHPLYHYERYPILCTCEVCIRPITASGVGCRRCNFDLCASCYSLYMSNAVVRDVLRAALTNNNNNINSSNNSHHSTSHETHGHVHDASTNNTKNDHRSIHSATSFNFRNYLYFAGGHFHIGPLNSIDESTHGDNNSKNKELQVINNSLRAHLFVSVGDLERFFRTGATSTKGTQYAPTTLSSSTLALSSLSASASHASTNAAVFLTNLLPLITRVRSFLMRYLNQHQYHTLITTLLDHPEELTRITIEILRSFTSKSRNEASRSLLSDLENNNNISNSSNNTSLLANQITSSLFNKDELVVIIELIQIAMEERYSLYRPGVGLCALQETFLGLLYRQAFASGNMEVLLQLENCLLRCENSSQPLTLSNNSNDCTDKVMNMSTSERDVKSQQKPEEQYTKEMSNSKQLLSTSHQRLGHQMERNLPCKTLREGKGAVLCSTNEQQQQQQQEHTDMSTTEKINITTNNSNKSMYAENSVQEFAENCVSAAQTFVFHHFDHVNEYDTCDCGKFNRDGLLSGKVQDVNSVNANKNGFNVDSSKIKQLQMTLPPLAFRADMLLLIILHHLFATNENLEDTSHFVYNSTTEENSSAGDATHMSTDMFMEDGVDHEDVIDASLFLSNALTLTMVKSFEASALRVSMLPPQFALPRWVNFIIHNARFLIPFQVRDKLARFIACDARRCFIKHMYLFRYYRLDRSVSIIPGEWARVSNHKYSVHRDNLLHDAGLMLRKSADTRLPLSIEFCGDVGVGHGPTAQFFTLLSREVSTWSLHLWRTASDSIDSPQNTLQEEEVIRAVCNISLSKPTTITDKTKNDEKTSKEEGDKSNTEVNSISNARVNQENYQSTSILQSEIDNASKEQQQKEQIRIKVKEDEVKNTKDKMTLLQTASANPSTSLSLSSSRMTNSVTPTINTTVLKTHTQSSTNTTNYNNSAIHNITEKNTIATATVVAARKISSSNKRTVNMFIAPSNKKVNYGKTHTTFNKSRNEHDSGSKTTLPLIALATSKTSQLHSNINTIPSTSSSNNCSNGDNIKTSDDSNSKSEQCINNVTFAIENDTQRASTIHFPSMQLHSSLYMSIPPEGFYPRPMHTTNKYQNNIFHYTYSFHSLPIDTCKCIDGQAGTDDIACVLSNTNKYASSITTSYHTHSSPLTDESECEGNKSNKQSSNRVCESGKTDADTYPDSTILLPLKEKGRNEKDILEIQRQQHAWYVIGAALGRAFADHHVFPLPLSPALGLFLRRRMNNKMWPITSSFCFNTNSNINTSAADEMKMRCNSSNRMHELTLESVRLVDRGMYKSLKELSKLDPSTLESLEIPFTLPGCDDVELITNGSTTLVNSHNLPWYQLRVAQVLLYESVALPIHFMTMGCNDVVPCEALQLYETNELIECMCGEGTCCNNDNTTPLWTRDDIRSVLTGDHGYQNDSPQLEMLANVLANRLTPTEQRLFLQFCTGCPRLPLGGIRALGAITVVRRSDAFASIPHDDNTHFNISSITNNNNGIDHSNIDDNSTTSMKKGINSSASHVHQDAINTDDVSSNEDEEEEVYHHDITNNNNDNSGVKGNRAHITLELNDADSNYAENYDDNESKINVNSTVNRKYDVNQVRENSTSINSPSVLLLSSSLEEEFTPYTHTNVHHNSSSSNEPDSSIERMNTTIITTTTITSLTTTTSEDDASPLQFDVNWREEGANSATKLVKTTNQTVEKAKSNVCNKAPHGTATKNRKPDESDRDTSQVQTPNDIIVADLVCGKETHRSQSSMTRRDSIDVNESFYHDACANQWALPSVNTCFRYLKLPPYSNEDLMYSKLLISITQCGDAFELS